YCTNIDRQRHVTPSPNVYSAFYNFNDQWTSINATATGWYTGQPFFRRGKYTKALGTISSYTSAAIAGGDCGSYTVKGFNLYNTSGQGAVQGDSGGPLLLAYNGHYLIAGTTSGVAATVSQGFSAWISIPPGWTPCTATTPCP
ncbi:MAG: hypothetical protein ACOYMR_10505, partial [Ilumatobacteraceae bacterium]